MLVRSVPLSCWALGLVAAQDLFLSKSMDAHVDTLIDTGVNSSTLFLESRAPTKCQHQIGCAGDCDRSDAFNHWNDHGYNGAISKICFKVGSTKPIHKYEWIIGFKVCYAGSCVSEGDGAKESDCWNLQSGEVITEITGKACKPSGAQHKGVNTLTVKLSTGRKKRWGGRECPHTPTVSLKAAHGKHITAFYGRTSKAHIGWDGLLHNLGAYYDVGMARGSWVRIGGGAGTSHVNFKYSSCTESSSSSSRTITNAWSISVKSEVSEGFNSDSVDAKTSTEIVSSTASSFQETNCAEHSFSCNKHMPHAFQWQFRSNFDRHGSVTTKTDYYVCASSQNVCCLPGHFKNSNDVSKGCKSGPNLCHR